MSNPQPPSVLPKWLSRTVVVLLAVQVGLLWTHGSLLQRQHDDIQALREDVQALTDSLYDEEDQDGWDSNQANPNPHPARSKGRRGGQPVPVAFMRATGEADEGDPALKEANKELDASLKSGKEAVVQARKVQEQLSLSANYEKAEARKRQEAETRTWVPWIWAAVAVALGSMLARSLYRRRA